MSYCIFPGCSTPENSNTATHCQCCGSPLRLQERYRPLKPIGQGGFGKTFLAADEQIPSKPPCVIKQFSFGIEDPQRYKAGVKLFRQEAMRLDSLGQHPQIPQLLAHFQENQRCYLIQEYIEGLNLKEELQQQGTFNEAKIWQLLRELLPVLKFVHENRVIHRDIKPANIIRRTADPFNYMKPPYLPECNGENRVPVPENQIVLIDFGVAKLVTGTAIARTGTIVGSAEYMAPEQTRGKVLPASDLFSLGVTCIYLMTDVAPWDMYDIVDERWRWRDFLPSGSSASDRLGQILDKLLANSLTQRFQSADSVLAAMKPPKPASAKPGNKAKEAIATQLISTPPPLTQALIGRIIPWLAPQPTDNELASAAGVDYRTLQNLLATRRWKEADLETWIVLSLAAGKRRKTYLFTDDIDRISCTDMKTIDRLWVKYSGGRFGFSVQAKIYRRVDEDYGKFCDRVGWLTYNPHNCYDGLKFKYSAPVGHLPSRVWAGGSKWWTHAEAIATKLTKCGTRI